MHNHSTFAAGRIHKIAHRSEFNPLYLYELSW